MSDVPPTFFAINTGEQERIQLNGILYRVRKNRGPNNMELIDRDLKWGATTDVSRLHDVPLKYDHGKDPRFGHREIGRISSARLLNTNLIFIECYIYNEKDDKLPAHLIEIIREEVRSGKISMFSMFWDASVIGELNGEAVIDPSDRAFREVSICNKGFYAEARIVSLAASADSKGLSKL